MGWGLAALALLVSTVAANRCGPSLSTNGQIVHIRNPNAAPQSKIDCSWYPSVDNLPRQCCCAANGTHPPRCLPRVIIAGAQKSGTTALFGYLLMHPQFAPPRRKEVHSFDKEAPWHDKPHALASYLAAMSPYNASKVRDV